MKNILAIIFLSSLVLTSCRKDDKDEPVSSNPKTTASVYLEMNYMFGDDMMMLDKPFLLPNDTLVKITRADLYISGLALTTSMDGNSPDSVFENNIQFISQSNPEMELYLGELTPALIPETYHRLKLSTGLDAETNSLSEADFTSYPSTHPLGVKVPSMHWTWNAGYIFMAVEGVVDSNNDGVIDEMDEVFMHHIGGNNAFKDVMLGMSHPVLEPNSDYYFHLTIDYKKFFTDIDVANNLSVKMPMHSLVGKISENMASMITENSGSHQH